MADITYEQALAAVRADGSLGIHNHAMAKTLLQEALQKLTPKCSPRAWG